MGAPTAKLETVVIISPYKVLSLFFTILSLLCLVIVIPSTFWFHADRLIRYGLWQECVVESIQSINNLDINAFIFALLSCILLLICLLTDNWLTSNDVKQGLWRNCTLASSIPTLAYSIRSRENINDNDFYICVPLNILWVQLCGSFIVVAFSCTVIGIILIVIGLRHKRRQERKMKLYGAAGFVAFVGILCILTALILFPVMFIMELHERGKDTWYFGWSYGVAWGSFFFLTSAAILLMCDRKREELFYKESLYINNDEEDILDNQDVKIKTLNR
ncbi:transmembrane 47 isoform X2 [Brachionus plicatilis]|uniref:Transmembrane 47 isoform X2 n=1 Tax=Brachionus plicatilis TaxID=10195 RepID=A0A3M7RLL9_BRAPC|nr:transmembrane 47 isoform X2 [Brachionus plicatilis]